MIKKAILSYITEKKYDKRYAEKLRGYFGNLYKEEDLFHNHNNEKSIYRMPLIQYKVIEGNLSIIGINEGAELVAKEFIKHKKLNIGNEIIEKFETKLSIKEEEFYVAEELFSYKFDSIWLALNQENYKKYLKEEEFNLDKILTNNILSNFKGCGITASKKIMVKGNFQKIEAEMKNNEMIGFIGEFVSNVKMPDFLGIGKRRAIGYGTVIKNDKSII